MKRITLTLAALFLLSGCTTMEYARPPADKLVCPDEPDSPAVDGQPVTDDQAGEYMKHLRGAGQGCRDDVNWLRDWFANLPG